MAQTDRIILKELAVWFGDQLSHPLTLFKRKTWGVFSVYAHVRRSDKKVKSSSPTKEQAMEASKLMSQKYGRQYDAYKCLYCSGWHIAEVQSPDKNINNLQTTSVPTAKVQNNLELDKILVSGIPDIAPVFGGVRGRTMSSKQQFYAWPIIKDAGVKTIIDLREDGLHSRLKGLCDKFGMDYFYYPVYKHRDEGNIETMINLFPELRRRIDDGRFYIACAQGLHRTDIALCLYWMFYAADKGIEAPEIRGFREIDGRDTSKILRAINEFYRYWAEKNGVPPLPYEVLKQRKAIIEANSKLH
ncbi:MAG: hypothetical protein NC336_03370 [Clostridium sp.]|nr:hypothetical protein [Clostridium sp.]